LVIYGNWATSWEREGKEIRVPEIKEADHRPGLGEEVGEGARENFELPGRKRLGISGRGGPEGSAEPLSTHPNVGIDYRKTQEIMGVETLIKFS